MKKAFILLCICSIVLIAIRCSRITKQDIEQRIFAYLEAFAKDLNASEEKALGHFRVSKSKEAIEKAIKILQNSNQENQNIRCVTNFNKSKIKFGVNDWKVTVPVEIMSLSSSYPRIAKSEFTMWLTPEQKSFAISEFDAQELYGTYRSISFELENQKNYEIAVAKKERFFQRATELQQSYDSVIWFTQYRDSTYYYVVNGSFNNFFLNDKGKRPEVSMGLVSESGRIIVPAEYDLVGTIGFEMPSVLEVKKNNKVGLFSIEGKELLSAQFDVLVPYQAEGISFLFRRDTVLGRINKNYEIQEGLQTNEQRYLAEFQYLSKPLTIDKNSTTMTEVLSKSHLGFGIVIPSNYLVAAGTLKEIEPYIYLGDDALSWGGTEYIRTEGSWFEKVTENISAIFVKVKESYLEGREGFYESNQITFVDEKNNPILTTSTRRGSVEMTVKDSVYLEVKTSYQVDNQAGYWRMGGGKEWNFPDYKYFYLGETKKALESNRRYPFTQFVKLDSSYLKGQFDFWDNEKQAPGVSDFVSMESLTKMRNEILASYGYIFADENTSKEFEYFEWYKPISGRYKEVKMNMTKVDLYNLAFLERMIGTLNAETSL